MSKQFEKAVANFDCPNCRAPKGESCVGLKAGLHSARVGLQDLADVGVNVPDLHAMPLGHIVLVSESAGDTPYWVTLAGSPRQEAAKTGWMNPVDALVAGVALAHENGRDVRINPGLLLKAIEELEAGEDDGLCPLTGHSDLCHKGEAHTCWLDVGHIGDCQCPHPKCVKHGYGHDLKARDRERWVGKTGG